MLGDKIGEEKGKVTTRRVLKGDDAGSFVKLEVSFESECTILGVQGMNMGTYTVFERGPGQMYAEGQGIFGGPEGSNAIWNGHGVGVDAGDGVIAIAASVAFQTNSESLKRLNSVLVVIEHKNNMMDGSASSTLYEWKA
jgi:hypothetical protein